jgi:HAD superfamily hydrolase (TIGR01509 family)
MPMQQIKFVYFDVGSVLIDWQNVFTTAAQHHKLTVDEIGSVFDENSEDITKGIMSPANLWQEVIKKYHVKNASHYDFLTSWVADYKPIAPTHALIHDIKHDYKIGLLSNIYKGMLPQLLEKELIPNIEYQSIVFSCDVGMMKPEPEIYLLAQKQINVNPEEILFIDDKQENLDAAASLGWRTFLFDASDTHGSVKILENHFRQIG